jgi:hypothetical protein
MSTRPWSSAAMAVSSMVVLLWQLMLERPTTSASSAVCPEHYLEAKSASRLNDSPN